MHSASQCALKKSLKPRVSKKNFPKIFHRNSVYILEQTYFVNFVGFRPNYGPNFSVIKILIIRLMNTIMVDYEQKTFK